MTVFIQKLQKECRELAVDAFVYVQEEQNKSKDYVNDVEGLLEGLVQRKALTYITVTMNLFAFKYLPALERGEIPDPDEETIRALPQAMKEIAEAEHPVFKKAFSICNRAMRLSTDLSRQLN